MRPIAVRNHRGKNGLTPMMKRKDAISLLVPPNSPILAEDLRDRIRSKCPRARTSVKKSAGNFSYIEVASGPSRQETWWAVRQVVSEVEQRHQSGRVVEMMG